MQEVFEVYDHIEPDIKNWAITKQSERRVEVIDEVIDFTYHRLLKRNDGELERLLEKTIYRERIRIKNQPWRVDPPKEKSVWDKHKKELQRIQKLEDKEVQENLMKKMIRSIVSDYSNEIVGSFIPKTFRFARKFLTKFFKLLLSRNVVRKNLGIWGTKNQLYNRLKIYGDIDHIRNLAQNGTVVIVPTHFSNLDSILIGYAIDAKVGIPAPIYGAGLNLYNFGPAAYFMNRLGAYRIDRRKKNPIYMETLKAYSTLNLQKGVHSLFFPGGTRSRNGAVEEKLKLGLLSTVIEAQRTLCSKDDPNKLFIVPLVLDYHFVLEGKSLIRQWLKNSGQDKYSSRQILTTRKRKIFRFLWEYFYESSEIVLSFGNPMDVLGNPVNQEGRSIDLLDQHIRLADYFKKDNEVNEDLQRESMYAKLLGEKIVERFKKDNVVLSSHLVAFTAFRLIKSANSSLDIYGLLQLPKEDYEIPVEEFYNSVELLRTEMIKMESSGLMRLSEPIFWELKDLIENGLKHLGMYHSKKPLVLTKDKQIIYSDDLELLFYYHNRLMGYHLESLLDEVVLETTMG